MPNSAEAFRIKLNEVIDSGALSRAELAKRTGIAWANIDGYLKGKNTPGLVQADKIAQACGYTLSEFLRVDGATSEHSIQECIRRVTDAALKNASAPSDEPNSSEKKWTVQELADAIEKDLFGEISSRPKKHKA